MSCSPWRASVACVRVGTPRPQGGIDRVFRRDSSSAPGSCHRRGKMRPDALPSRTSAVLVGTMPIKHTWPRKQEFRPGDRDGRNDRGASAWVDCVAAAECNSAGWLLGHRCRICRRSITSGRGADARDDNQRSWRGRPTTASSRQIASRRARFADARRARRRSARRSSSRRGMRRASSDVLSDPSSKPPTRTGASSKQQPACKLRRRWSHSQTAGGEVLVSRESWSAPGFEDT